MLCELHLHYSNPIAKDFRLAVLFVYNISVTEKMTAWFGNVIDGKKEEREEAV